MATDSRLHRISEIDNAARATVVFVHGLSGHPFDTWRQNEKREWRDDPTFWPQWLRDDLKQVNVYSMEYPADISAWTGHAMPIQFRAANMLEHLLVEPEAINHPLYFICHSLGGLVVKQVIRRADTEKDARPEAGRFLMGVAGVIFMATPHSGASLASTLSYFGGVLKLSPAITSLLENDPSLIDLNQWYRNWADAHQAQCRHRVFFETQSIKGVTTVPAGTADPGLVKTPVVAIDADHISICKPADRGALAYKSIRSFLAPAAEANTSPLGKSSAVNAVAQRVEAVAGRSAQPSRNPEYDIFTDGDLREMVLKIDVAISVIQKAHSYQPTLPVQVLLELNQLEERKKRIEKELGTRLGCF